MKFEELKLSYGFPLQMQLSNPQGQPERYGCRLIGCLPGRGLLVSVPKSEGRLIKLRSGQKLVFRFMFDNGVGLFVAMLEQQTSEPYPILHLTYPETVNFKGIRSTTRVAVNLNASVNLAGTTDGARLAGQIIDMSVAGLRLDSTELIAEPEEQLDIQVQLSVEHISRLVQLKGTIKSRINPEEAGGKISYGVALEKMEENQFLLLYGFVTGLLVNNEVPGEG